MHYIASRWHALRVRCIGLLCYALRCMALRIIALHYNIIPSITVMHARLHCTKLHQRTMHLRPPFTTRAQPRIHQNSHLLSSCYIYRTQLQHATISLPSFHCRPRQPCNHHSNASLHCISKWYCHLALHTPVPPSRRGYFPLHRPH